MDTIEILAILAIGYFVLNGKKTVAPVFVDATGKPLGNAIHVGATVSFYVPGYSRVWLVQTKDGQPHYNGPENSPSQLYTLTAADAGTYVNAAYTISASGQGPGTIIGQITTVVS